MCDQDSFGDMLSYSRRADVVSRRQFGALSVGAGLTMMLPPVANAADIVESDVEIKTTNGSADAYLVHPASGKSAGVLMWPDIFGLRPAFRMMGKRLAEAGYTVLVPNPFYRIKRAPIVPPGASFQDEATRNTLMGMMQSLTPTTQQTDARAFIPFLDQQASIDRKRKLATTGYCMGGPIAFRTAATFPGRVGALASFHGANLVSNNPDSPHLLIPSMKAAALIAIAANDDEKQPEAKNVLRESFAKAKLAAEIEVYAGTMHGWCPPDSAVYNEAQAEKAWGRMLDLFKKSLA
jgi:carboxymethylenebutenolidase